MVTISIILLVSHVYGEYTVAGLASAIYTISQALFAPQIAKLVDRYGQAKVMRPFLTVAMTGLAGLAFAAGMGANPVWVYVAAGISGACMGSMGAMTRSRWSHVIETPGHLHTAYSWESVLDELVFVTGPVLATFLATQFTPLAGLIVAIVIAASGGFWFLSQRATEPATLGKDGASSPGSVLTNPGMIVLVFVFLCLGSIFGASDVSTIAYSEELGKKGYAGLVLASLATGSLISGLFYGTRSFVTALWKQFVFGITAVAAGASLFMIISGLPILATAMFVTGFAVAPTVISGNNLVQQFVPSHRLTEGLAWTGTSIGLGFALGSAVGGRVIDTYGAHSGFYTVFAAGVLAVTTTLVAAPVLRRLHNQAMRGHVNDAGLEPEG